jgi:hypothetical protein
MGESFPAKAGTASRHVQDLKLSYPMYTYMGRPTYVCGTCEEHFTRRYSATRHNLTIHNGRGEIVGLMEYLAGRNSGRYQPSRPSLYRRPSKKCIHRFRHAISADSMGNFRPRVLQHETPFQSISTPLSLSSTSQPQPLRNNQGTLSEETILITCIVGKGCIERHV